MCGIVGYTGKKNCLPLLIEGLRLLEYRGYDSAGISLAYERSIRTVKASGKLSKLEERLQAEQLAQSNCGIGHTRWATHGAPSDVNSHPHTADSLALVHNGIIENYNEIDAMLRAEGYAFASDTDTERAAKLIDFLYKQTAEPVSAIFKACEILKGSYAFGIIFKDFPNKIYAVRKDSPLMIGFEGEDAFLASDIPAILPYTKRFCRLDEGLVAELSCGSVKFYDKSFSQVNVCFETVKWTSEQAQKNGFPHFMLKEIHEEPQVLSSMIQRRLKNSLPCFENEIDEEILKNADGLHVIACGTAMHAGLVGKYIIEKLARVPVTVEIASEFRYGEAILRKNEPVIFLSQSGETADTIAALRRTKELGHPTIAVVNVFGSTIAREADYVLYTHAGPEISVASTKAYSVQCAMLYLLAIRFAIIKGKIDEKKAAELCSLLSDKMPSAINETLAKSEEISKLCQGLTNAEHLFYIGRGIDYQLAVEASLKLKEISYIHSEAYAAGELKHGTISLITEGIPVIAIVTDSALAQKSLVGVQEVISRGADVTLICSAAVAKNHALPQCKSVILPEADEFICPFITATAVQLLAYHTSAKKGLDVDKPRNLAKSVTVE